MGKYAVGILPVAIVGGIIFVAAFIWYGCRIEPEDGQVAVLIRKTGENLPPGEIIATDSKYKGIQLETIGEGRYFRNPYVWDWRIVNIIDISDWTLLIYLTFMGRQPFLMPQWINVWKYDPGPSNSNRKGTIPTPTIDRRDR